MKKVLLIVIAVVLALVIAGLIVASVMNANMTIDADKEIVVEEGASTTAIATELEEAGLIKNSDYFRLFARMKGIDGTFKAGTYNFTAGEWNTGSVSEMLVKGIFSTTGDARITIVEGLTVKQVVQVLADNGLGSVDEYMNYIETGDFSAYEFIPAADSVIEPATRLEGFLYPDTYMIDPAWSEKQIINMLLDQFVSVWEGSGYDRLAADAGKSTYEIITMAALVEKEAKVAEDRPLIAGVFYKRIELGMNLQSCATIQFLLGEPKEKLLYSDLQIDSPYNVYMYEGLPPGPIACPGKASIEAALSPEESDYLYFRAKDDGSHRFSETFTEHTTYKEGDQK